MEEQKKRSFNWLSILVIAAIAAGIYFYINRGPENNIYYAYYNNIKGLQQSSPVIVKGVHVGKIKELQALHDRIKVTITIEPEVKVTKGTTALLASGGVMSDKTVLLELGNSTEVLPSGSILQSNYDSTAMEVSVQITPYIETAKYLLRSTDSTLRGLTDLSGSGLLTTVTGTLIMMEKNLKNYEGLSKGVIHSLDQISPSVHSMQQSTADLAAKNEDIRNTIRNADKQTTELAAKPLGENVRQFGASIKSLSASIKKATSEDSGMGKVLNDKTAYNNASNSLDTLNSTMKETYNDPPGFSIFGKSKKKKK